MNSRERVETTLLHEEPDRIPLDLGGSAVTGMHVSTVYALRQALMLDQPGTPVKVTEPFQMLGEIKADLWEVLGVDIACLGTKYNMFGYENAGWKPWILFDGTPVEVPNRFNTVPEKNGDILMYPRGDDTVEPCARMPKGGFYFDAIDRQLQLNWNHLNPEDNLEEFTSITNDECKYIENEVKRLYNETDKAIFANFGGTSFGDIALVPGLQILNPRGIRGVKEWYMCHVRRPDYLAEIFDRQCDIAVCNLEKIYHSIGNKVTTIFVTGTDFGSQTRTMISPQTYRKLYLPYHKQINDWIHEHTNWKTFIHSCGSIEPLIREFVDAGFDILNPVQTSASNMSPAVLKKKYGEKVTFWGGGVDTQRTLPFGTPEEVRIQVQERLDIFSPGGGYVFNTIHNVQPKIPIANVLSMYTALKDHRNYSKRIL